MYIYERTNGQLYAAAWVVVVCCCCCRCNRFYFCPDIFLHARVVVVRRCTAQDKTTLRQQLLWPSTTSSCSCFYIELLSQAPHSAPVLHSEWVVNWNEINRATTMLLLSQLKPTTSTTVVPVLDEIDRFWRPAILCKNSMERDEANLSQLDREDFYTF